MYILYGDPPQCTILKYFTFLIIRFSAADRADIAKKIQYFTSDLLKLKPIEFESIELREASEAIKLEPYCGRSLSADKYEFCSDSDQSPTMNIQRTEIVHIESPAKFYIRKHNINQIELNKYADISTIAPTPELSTVYLAQKSNDKNWYRAKVCGRSSEKEFLMVFIDYGFKHVVNKSK